MGEQVYFSLGSNQGDRQFNLERALDLLSGYCHGLVASRIYETEPLHIKHQTRFLNVAAMAQVSCSPLKILKIIAGIEKRLGRIRGSRYGPRIIDIDILLFGRRIIETRVLTVPHPRLTQRRFAVIPLLELDPALTDPASGERYWKSLIYSAVGGVYFHSFSRYTKNSLLPLDARIPIGRKHP